MTGEQAPNPPEDSEEVKAQKAAAYIEAAYRVADERDEFGNSMLHGLLAIADELKNTDTDLRDVLAGMYDAHMAAPDPEYDPLSMQLDYFEDVMMPFNQAAMDAGLLEFIGPAE
jgi:hypothetical protein